MRRAVWLALAPGTALATPKFVAAPQAPKPEVAEPVAEPASGSDWGAMAEAGLAQLSLTPETAAWGALGVVVLLLVLFGRGRRPKPEPRDQGRPGYPHARGGPGAAFTNQGDDRHGGGNGGGGDGGE